jgi:hypothetical protein
MQQIFIFLTFIPWFFYYFSQTKSNLKIINNNEDNSWRKNFLDIIPLNNIILYAILIYFSSYYNDSSSIFIVRIMLFSAINLYLFFNTISRKDYITIFEDSKESIPIKYILIALIPIISFFFTKQHMMTYYIMISFNILNYLLIKIIGLPKDEK